jgi:alkaline phosphatase D
LVESTIDSTSSLEGRFRTLPTAGTAADFTVAFSGDTDSGSNHEVFDTIREEDPLFFIHLGDLHYDDISTNNQSLFQTAYDQVFKSSRQSRLYREVPAVYVWDDHDYGANNSDGTSASKPAAATVYRSRVPHYPLEEATGIYHSFDVGRVRFIITDQRSAASPNSDTDNSSKTMLGTTQKTWFFNLLQNSPGKLIVWICPRHFASATAVGSDSWGGFSTERTEIGAHVAANCPGRVIILSADVHVLGIDDGSNRTFGGNAFPTFQAAPLDQGSNFPGDIFSEGSFGGNGQWGSMQIEDDGGSDIDVTWRGYDSTGDTLVTYAFSVDVT